jgi:hypothetical protein
LRFTGELDCAAEIETVVETTLEGTTLEGTTLEGTTLEGTTLVDTTEVGTDELVSAEIEVVSTIVELVSMATDVVGVAEPDVGVAADVVMTLDDDVVATDLVDVVLGVTLVVLVGVAFETDDEEWLPPPVAPTPFGQNSINNPTLFSSHLEHRVSPGLARVAA